MKINNLSIIRSVKDDMAYYTNEEYYDTLMALGECHGQYHAYLQYDTLNYIRTEEDIHRLPSYFVQLRDCAKLAMSCRTNMKLEEIARQEIWNMETVVRVFEQNPETSIRVVAREHNLSYATVQRILKEEKLHAFHYTRVQHLRPADYRARRIFCENFLRKVDRNHRFSSYVIFSDESLFTQEGIFNSHNMHLWSDENPRSTRLRSFQVRWKMNLWTGIMGNQILGPVILSNILTGETYVQLLRDNLPDFLEEVPLFDRNKIVFQQDGAGPHNARIVTNYLNEQFPGRWMGRYGPIRWPARSPDLNPLDFFFWGYCKELVYKTLPEDLEDLDTRLRHAVWAIEEDTMRNVQRNLLKRMRTCIRMNGGHFEHLLP